MAKLATNYGNKDDDSRGGGGTCVTKKKKKPREKGTFFTASCMRHVKGVKNNIFES